MKGRKPIEDGIKQKAIELRKQGLSFRKIKEQLTYTTKAGKTKNISISWLSQNLSEKKVIQEPKQEVQPEQPQAVTEQKAEVKADGTTA